MGRARQELVEVMVDLSIEVDSRGIDLDVLVGGITAPGQVLLRTSGHHDSINGRVWLTTLTAGADVRAAAGPVRDQVLGQLAAAGVRASVRISAAPLDELLAELPADAAEAGEFSPSQIDLTDLASATLWERPARVLECVRSSADLISA